MAAMRPAWKCVLCGCLLSMGATLRAKAATLSVCEMQLLKMRRRVGRITPAELASDEWTAALRKAIRTDLLRAYEQDIDREIERANRTLDVELGQISRRIPRGKRRDAVLREVFKGYATKVIDAYIASFGRVAQIQRHQPEPEIEGLAEEQAFEASLPYKRSYARYWQAQAALDPQKNAEALAQARRDFLLWLAEIKHPMYEWDLFDAWNESEHLSLLRKVTETDPEAARLLLDARKRMTDMAVNKLGISINLDVQTPEPLIDVFPWHESRITTALVEKLADDVAQKLDEGTKERPSMSGIVHQAGAFNRAWQRAFFTAAIKGPHATAFVPNRSRFGNLLVVLDGYQLAFRYRNGINVPDVAATFYSEDELLRMLPQNNVRPAPAPSSSWVWQAPRASSAAPEARVPAEPSREEESLQASDIWKDLDEEMQAFCRERVREHPERLSLVLSFAELVTDEQLEASLVPPLKSYLKRLLLAGSATDDQLLSKLESRVTSLRYQLREKMAETNAEGEDPPLPQSFADVQAGKIYTFTLRRQPALGQQRICFSADVLRYLQESDIPWRDIVEAGIARDEGQPGFKRARIIHGESKPKNTYWLKHMLRGHEHERIRTQRLRDGKGLVWRLLFMEIVK